MTDELEAERLDDTRRCSRFGCGAYYSVRHDPVGRFGTWTHERGLCPTCRARKEPEAPRPAPSLDLTPEDMAVIDEGRRRARYRGGK